MTDLGTTVSAPTVRPRSRAVGALRAVNAFLTAKQVGIGLILTMGLLSLIGTVVPQVPVSIREDPRLYGVWLGTTASRWGPATDLLYRLGAFSMFSSLVFQAVAVLLATSTAACTIQRVPTLWRRAVTPPQQVPTGMFAAVDGVVTEMDVATATVRARAVLAGAHLRVLAIGQDLYADRFRFPPLGTGLSHLAFVLIIAGGAVSGSSGFRDDPFPVTVGASVPVGHGTGLTITAESFTVAYDMNGSPMDYASQVVVAGPGDPVSATIRVNEPLRTHGVTVYQSTYGTSAVIRVLDRQGDVVVDGAVPLLWQSPDGRIAYGEVRVPDRGLLVYVATPASGKTVPTIRSGQIQVDLVDLATGTVLASTLADPGRPAVAGDHIVLFARERPFTGLVVARDPGAPFVWVAAALLILGIVTTMFFRYRRVWVRITPHGTGSLVHVAVPDRRDPAADTLSARIASAISAGPSVGGTP